MELTNRGTSIKKEVSVKTANLQQAILNVVREGLKLTRIIVKIESVNSRTRSEI